MVRQTNTHFTRSWQRVVLLEVLLVAMAAGRASAITKDPTLEAGFHAMYGLDFASAGRLFADYEYAHATDPLGYAAESTCLVFSELNRLKLLEAEFETDDRKFLAKPAAPPDLRLKEQIFDLSQRAQHLAEARLQHDPGDEQALFALALTNGILGDYTALVEHRYWNSVKYGRQGDEFARELLRYDPLFYDAYVWTGVTNYIYGSLPWPVRLPARLFGLRGDKGTGVANLRLAAEKGQYLKPYAKLLLSIAYLREKNKPAAAALLSELSSEFPNNPLFAAQSKRLATNGM
jgi:hypothetical protein